MQRGMRSCQFADNLRLRLGTKALYCIAIKVSHNRLSKPCNIQIYAKFGRVGRFSKKKVFEQPYKYRESETM